MSSRAPLVVVDTSAAIEALISDAEFHAPYVELFACLRAQGYGIACSELIEPELIEAAYSWNVRRLRPRTWRVERRAGVLERPKHRELTILDEWRRFVGEDDLLMLPVAAVAPAAVEIVHVAGLTSYDAVHVATAVALEVPIVTHDRGMVLSATPRVRVITERSEW